MGAMSRLYEIHLARGLPIRERRGDRPEAKSPRETIDCRLRTKDAPSKPAAADPQFLGRERGTILIAGVEFEAGTGFFRVKLQALHHPWAHFVDVGDWNPFEEIDFAFLDPESQ